MTTQDSENTSDSEALVVEKLENVKSDHILDKSRVFKVLLTVIGLVGFCVTVCIILFCIITFRYLENFSKSSGVPLLTLKSDVENGLREAPIIQERINFLILGLDEIAIQREGSLLTDTILIASYEPRSTDIKIVSLPRDLWISAYKTKLNSLYYYGENNPDTSGKVFSKSIVEDITGLSIDHVIILKLRYLEELIDILGGVEVEVLESFTDEEFPREDVDIKTVTDPKLLYETITFKAGSQIMDGKTAMKYIRSRHSTDRNEGTDLARSKRQQQLVYALAQKVMSREILMNSETTGLLYKWLQLYIFDDSLTPSKLIAYAKLITGLHRPQISSLSIPIDTSDFSNGLLVNPPIAKYQQWVYEPKDPSWNQLKKYLRESIY